MVDIWTIVRSVSTAIGVLVGMITVAYQLHKQSRWHIQHSTLEMTNRFVEGDIFQHWLRVRDHLMMEAKQFDELTEDQKSVISLLSYFETIGVMYKETDLFKGYGLTMKAI